MKEVVIVVLAAALVLGAAVGLPLSVESGYKMGVEDTQRMAAIEGHGWYEVDRRTGKVVFTWTVGGKSR